MRRIRLGLLLKDESPLEALGVIKTAFQLVAKANRLTTKKVNLVYSYYIRPACCTGMILFLQERMPASAIPYSLG